MFCRHHALVGVQPHKDLYLLGVNFTQVIPLQDGSWAKAEQYVQNQGY